MEDIFREELKDIKQFWGSKKNNSKRPHRMSLFVLLWERLRSGKLIQSIYVKAQM